MSPTAPPGPHPREQVRLILEAALRAVDPERAVRSFVAREGRWLRIGAQAYDLESIERVVVVGAGKAGAPMAAAVWDLLGERIERGLVVVKHGHVTLAAAPSVAIGPGERPTLVPAPAHTGRIALVEAGHPEPDASGRRGASGIAALLAGLTASDLAIVLLSGGGSALLPLPAPGITPGEYRILNIELLRSGADITALNTVRKHCSGLQGGRLAALAAPAQVATLILSDVIGSPLDVIASGPTAPDPTTYDGALEVLGRCGLLGRAPPAVLAHLRRGAAGEIGETPKPGDPVFGRVQNLVIGENAAAGRAAVDEARRLGMESLLLTTHLQGEAREVGRAVAGMALGMAGGGSDLRPPACLVMGGETTVTVRGEGKGGRNQELALAAALTLAGTPGAGATTVAATAVVVSLGTDGTDGPTDAAGGWADGTSASRARALGLDAAAALETNDSYPLLGALSDLIVTGPTGTNVNDLVLACAFPTG
jgi:hydroxypyruvate reductase